MATSGGAANIYGIVYQILRTAKWAVQMHLTAPAKSLRSASLVAEPRAGGDLQVKFADRRVVLQFKTRSGSRTWSLREVVDEVLPDLYGQVDLLDGVETRFEFVTNGRMGNWRAALEFFDQLGKGEPPKSPLRTLDDRTLTRFFGQGRCTRRELFRTICDSVRRRATAKNEPLLLTRRRVWHLLGRFRFVPTGDAAEAKESMRTMLRAYLDDDKAAELALSAVVDTLLEYSSEGNVTFTPAELLQAAGINPEVFAGEDRFREALRQVTRNDTRQLVRFRPDLSVRRPYAWRSSKRLLCFRGPAGCGKSWTLAGLASEAEGNSLSTFLRASGDPRRDLERAAKLVVEDLLGCGVMGSLDA
ncbi:MAG TPA: hypothetical protein VN181_12510, partial [Thermoanaerobaculia bacterium]|nr:hypothetical protein [Thermoanaerobaculia bacterium]